MCADGSPGSPVGPSCFPVWPRSRGPRAQSVSRCVSETAHTAVAHVVPVCAAIEARNCRISRRPPLARTVLRSRTSWPEEQEIASRGASAIPSATTCVAGVSGPHFDLSSCFHDRSCRNSLQLSTSVAGRARTDDASASPVAVSNGSRALRVLGRTAIAEIAACLLKASVRRVADRRVVHGVASRAGIVDAGIVRVGVFGARIVRVGVLGARVAGRPGSTAHIASRVRTRRAARANVGATSASASGELAPCARARICCTTRAGSSSPRRAVVTSAGGEAPKQATRKRANVFCMRNPRSPSPFILEGEDSR